jgi:hypothetical protein
MTACLHFHVSTQGVELCRVLSVHAMKAYRGTRGRHIAPSFLSSALFEVELLNSRPGRFIRGNKDFGTDWVGR